LWELWGCIPLYEEQALEGWHGHFEEDAVKYPGSTELERAAAFMWSMAVARAAKAEVLARRTKKRKPAAAGVRNA